LHQEIGLFAAVGLEVLQHSRGCRGGVSTAQICCCKLNRTRKLNVFRRNTWVKSGRPRPAGVVDTGRLGACASRPPPTSLLPACRIAAIAAISAGFQGSCSISDHRE
jgi:hypothetical protein